MAKTKARQLDAKSKMRSNLTHHGKNGLFKKSVRRTGSSFASIEAASPQKSSSTHQAGSGAKPYIVDWPTAPKVEQPWIYWQDLTSQERRDRTEKVKPYLIDCLRVAQDAQIRNLNESKEKDGRVMERIRQHVPPPQRVDDILDAVSMQLGLPDTDILAVMLRAIARQELVLVKGMMLTIPEDPPVSGHSFVHHR